MRLKDFVLSGTFNEDELATIAEFLRHRRMKNEASATASEVENLLQEAKALRLQIEKENALAQEFIDRRQREKY